MLPSSGLFAEISCPFLKRGLCERPHCLYKHERDALQPPAAAELPGIPNYCPTPLSGVLVNGDTSAECLQELERINKEIETIKNEVEKEQRRLSRFQTEQVDGLGAAPERPVSRCGTAGKGVKAGPQRPKYVVDGSRPRTDLEYDPLSNFSADLRSYSSSGREQNGKSGGAKRARKPGGEQSDAGPARESSPEPPDDLLEEGDLVIDIPSSPDKKRSRLHDLCVGQDAAAEAEGVSADIAPTRAANDAKSGSSPELPVPHSDGAEDDTGCPLEAPVARPRESEPYDVFDGLSRCLENLKSENRRFTRSQAHGVMEESGSDDVDAEAGSPSASSPDPSRAVPVEERAGSPQSAAPCRSDDTNVARLRGEEEESSASFPCESLTLAAHQAQRTEQPAHKTAQHQLRSPAPCARRPTDQTQGGGPAAADGGRDRPPSAPVPSASAPAAPLPGGAGVREVILIESSSEEEPGEELRYSDVDLSDSDPMEECYRIFMEAERADRVERAAAEPEDDADVEEPEVHVKPQPLPPQKRVAHVPKHTESAAASRPQPQVLVPLRGPYPAASAPRIQQVQQRAAALTASVKGGQSFVSSVAPSKTEDGAAPAPPAPPPPPPVSPLTLQPLHQAGQLGSLQNAYVKCIPAGTAVIRVGNNLHFIIPEGSYPLPVTPVPGSVSSVLTPLHAGSVPQVSRALQPTAVMAAHRYRAPGPAPIGASGSVSPFSTVSTLAQAGSAAAASAPQGAVHVPAKPLTKRKVKQRPERVKDKVPHDVRQRYVNMFTEELLKTSPNVKEAFDKALAEERTVYNRSANKLKYLSVAVNALKRLKNQSAVVAKGDNDTGRKRSKGNIPLHLAKLAVNGDAALYDSLKEYVLHEEKLIENNYPLLHPEKPGGAVLFSDNKKCTNDTLKRLCCRCGATYSVSRTGKHTRKEECTYHYGKGVENRVPGGVETRYSCCEGVMGAPGCQVFKLHVHDAVSLDGFVSTQRREDSDQRCPGVCSLDCEMCYTTHGLELSRVTVVDSSLQVVYDTFVRPENEVIDYNTRFSGISEKDVKKSSPSIREVQQTLLSFISADTIVIGHGLETDLCALKLLHGTVVDTSVVFPHRLGPPHKLTLNNLTADYLRRIIQDSVCGHDTADDAAACMELMLWKVKEDGKVKKW